MASRYSVVHILTKLELGGAQQIALYMVSHLDRNRFTASLIWGEPGYLDDEARGLPHVNGYQVPSLVRPVNLVKDLRALLSLTRTLVRLKPDIVHTHSSKAGILGRWAAALAGVPVRVHSIHGFGFHASQGTVMRAMLVAAERLTGRITGHFFPVSTSIIAEGSSLGIFDPDRCTILRPGIEREIYRRSNKSPPACPVDLDLPSGCQVVGMIAPFKPQKAPLDFIHVARRVHQEHPDVRFVLVGDGELRPHIEAMITACDLEKVVTLAGWRRDIPAVLARLDVFVLTSRWEGLPRVYLEALAAGVPVVGTDVDGASEVIHHAVNGYLVEPGDIEAMATWVLYLLRNPAERDRLGANAVKLPREFDLADMMDRLHQVYEKLLSQTKEEPTAHPAG